MTQPPQRVRAVARVGGSSGRPDAPSLLPRRRPGHLGPVHIMQLVLVEAAVIAVVASFGHGLLLISTIAVVALLLLVATLARYGGRWWLERRLMTWQYRQRQRRGGGPGPDPLVGALRQLSPGLVVEDVDAPDGAQVGVARDDAGWYAVAAVSPTAEMRDDPTSGVPLDLLVETLSEAGQPGVAVQVVLHTVPATGFSVDPGSPVGQSYRQLLTQSAANPIPVGAISLTGASIFGFEITSCRWRTASSCISCCIYAIARRNFAASLRGWEWAGRCGFRWFVT